MVENDWSKYASIGSVPFSNGDGFVNKGVIFFVVSEHELLGFTSINNILMVKRKHLAVAKTFFYKFLRRGR